MSSKKRWNPDIKRNQRTRPEHMGEQNLTKEMINAMKTDEQTIALQKQINDMVKNRKPYKSFTRNAIKHTITEIYLISSILARIHTMIKTISFAA